MAQKFNNGQTLGTIRTILNANADEINANATAAATAQSTANSAKTAAENAAAAAATAQGTANSAKTAAEDAATAAATAQSTAEKRASGVNTPAVPGIVDPPTFNQLSSVTDFETALGQGNLRFFQGKGVTMMRQLSAFDFHSPGAAANLNTGIIWILSGTVTKKAAGQYQWGWAAKYLNCAYMIMGYARALVFDMDAKEVWACEFGNTADDAWQKVGGSDYTLPVATAETLGGIKPGAGLTTDADGTTRIADNATLPGSPTLPNMTKRIDYDGAFYSSNDVVSVGWAAATRHLGVDKSSTAKNSIPSNTVYISDAAATINVYYPDCPQSSGIVYPMEVIIPARSSGVATIRVVKNSALMRTFNLTGLTPENGTRYIARLLCFYGDVLMDIHALV